MLAISSARTLPNSMRSKALGTSAPLSFPQKPRKQNPPKMFVHQNESEGKGPERTTPGRPPQHHPLVGGRGVYSGASRSSSGSNSGGKSWKHTGLENRRMAAVPTEVKRGSVVA